MRDALLNTRLKELRAARLVQAGADGYLVHPVEPAVLVANSQKMTRRQFVGLMAPARIIDYIVVHELCHLRHRDHTDAFWNEVDKVLPGYRERKEWLRQRGANLDI